jgi:hypothetical protein
MGEPIANAQISVNLNSSMELLDSGTSDKDGGLTMRLPMTLVDINIIWDKAVIYYESMYNVTQNTVKPISAWVYYVTFNTVDSRDKAVSGVQIEVISDIDYETTYIETSDSLGLATFRLPVAGYELNAYWQTVLVYNVANIDVTGDLGFYKLQLWIYYVNFVALDSRDAAVPNAQITLKTNVSQEVIETLMTSIDGTLESRLPIGPVDLQVFWKGVEVLLQSIQVTGDVSADSPVVLNCMVYYLTAKAQDSKNVPIADAKVTITKDSDNSIMDSMTTPDNGVIVSRLPVGDYSVTIEWFDVEVFSESGITMDDDLTRNLDCDVFYITIVAQDSGDVEVEDARIMLTHIEASKLLFTNTTDEFGLIQVRIPIGAYDVNIFWQDVPVFTGSYYFNKDDTVNIRCNIFYFIIKTEDSENEVLTNAQTVLLLSASQKVMATNNSGTGEMEFRLPTADYDILVYWRDVLVRSELDYSLISSHTLTLVCDVFYFDVYAVDIDNIWLENANIIIEFYENGEVFDSMVTDAGGYGGSKVPIGDYDISIYWKDIKVFTGLKHNINVSERYEKVCNVFYLTIKAVDKNNEPIDDVSVKVSTELTELNEHQYTDSKGVATFRLPIENYEINGRLQTNHLLKKIDEKKSSSIGLNTRSETVELKFSEYPPSFFTTPAFYGVTLPIIILLVILFLIWHFFLRKRKKGGEEEEVDDDHVVIPDTHRYKPVKGMKYDKIDPDDMSDNDEDLSEDEADDEPNENGEEKKEE